MSPSERKRLTLRNLQAAQHDGRKLAMLTCYDHLTARHLDAAGLDILLVGDSAANVILGHERTTRIDLDFLITLTEAVRRGAPNSFVMADMPFGSYHGSTGDAVDNVCRMVRQTGCDSVKLEATPRHLNLVQALNDAGVAVCVHLGLRPQSVQTIGYRVQAKSDEAINELIDLARDFQMNGASMILLEAVPPEASQQLCHEVDLPVIGCGAGPAPTAYVVVLQDLLGLTDRRPKFVPDLGVLPLPEAAKQWVEMVHSGRYPAAEHLYDAGRA